MNILALGKVTVPTAGTPVQITAAMLTAAGDGRPPHGQISKIEVFADPAMTGTTAYVKLASNGAIIKALPKPASGYVAYWRAEAPNGGNSIDPTLFAIDVATSGDGAYVSVWID